MPRFAVLALLSIAAVAAACSSSVVTGPERVAGTYTLLTVNGAALPATLSTNGATSTRVVSGTLTLSSGLAFSVHNTVQTLNAGAVVSTAQDSASGTIVVNGDNVVYNYTYPSVVQASGTVLNGVASIDLNTVEYRYAK